MLRKISITYIEPGFLTSQEYTSVRTFSGQPDQVGYVVEDGPFVRMWSGDDTFVMAADRVVSIDSRLVQEKQE